jgi:hypothetical protein
MRRFGGGEGGGGEPCAVDGADRAADDHLGPNVVPQERMFQPDPRLDLTLHLDHLVPETIDPLQAAQVAGLLLIRPGLGRYG